MNIVILTKDFYPSTSPSSKRFTGICNFFALEGHKVTVISETQDAISTHENIEIIKIKRFGRDSRGMLERLVNHSTYMFGTVNQGRKLKDIDIVIATSPPAFSLISGILLSKILKAKFVADLRDIWPDVFAQTGVLTEKHIVYKLFDIVAKSAYKKADLITTVTPGKKKLLINNYPEYKSKIKLISNGFNIEIFNHEIDEALASEFKGSINIVYTGKIGIAQDLKNLIRLAEDFSTDSRLKFHLFGDGRDADKIKKMIKENKMYNVKFYGYRSEREITTALRLSQISYVSLGSELLIDSVPTKMYESMIFGCPILLSAKGDSVELLSEYEFGKSSSPSDYLKLKNNFEWILANLDYYENKSEQVREEMISKYSRDVIAKDFLELLKDL